MAAGTSTSLCPLLFVSLFAFVSVGLRKVSVKLGKDATLQCYGPKNAAIMMLKWNKPDLQQPNYVLYFRQDRFYDDFQHEFFKGRVTLKDPEWKKTGNLSVILKNVTMNDTGTYECHAGYNDDVKLLSTVNLSVVDPPGQPERHTEDGGKESGSVGLIVGLSVPAVLVIVGVGAVFIYRTYRRRQNQDYQPPEDQGL